MFILGVIMFLHLVGMHEHRVLPCWSWVLHGLTYMLTLVFAEGVSVGPESKCHKETDSQSQGG